MTLYEQYAIACANLYGVAPEQQVLKLYNLHQGTSLAAPFPVDPDVLAKEFVRVRNGSYVRDSLDTPSLIGRHMHAIDGKPYYQPAREELIRYVDHCYFERTPSFERLIAFLSAKRLRAESIATQIRDMMFHGHRWSEIFPEAERLGLHFDNEAEIDEIAGIMQALNNELRFWENNGFTPIELRLLRDAKPADPILPGGETDPADELAAFLRKNGIARFRVPPSVRPFKALLARQKAATFSLSAMREADALGERLADAEQFTMSNVYNLLFACPFAYVTISVFLAGHDDEEEYEALLRCIVFAYETAHPDQLRSPSQDFYDREDNFYYILALDNLGHILKTRGRFDEAIKVYNKAIRLDLGDHQKIREAILLCYIATSRLDEFDAMLRRLPEDSLAGVFLKLLNLILGGKPAERAYRAAYERSPIVMDAVRREEIGIAEDASTEERLFVDDFYVLYRRSPQVRKKLDELSTKNMPS